MEFKNLFHFFPPLIGFKAKGLLQTHLDAEGKQKSQNWMVPSSDHSQR
jgi:hypothetical protein